MGQAINTVAFPVPDLRKEFYQEELLQRPDLIFLKTTANERIPACYVRAPGKQPAKMTFLYSHGNAEDLGLHLDYIDALARATGADVFSYEYVGYSLSRFEGGEPSEEGCLRSIQAAWRYCVDELKIPANRIIIYGRSIGSGPACDLAYRSSVEGTRASPLDAAGVLLQSPLESGGRIFSHMLSVVAYHLDIFRNYEKVPNVRCPIAIMHGKCDRVVPVTNGETLYELVPNKYQPLWVEGHGHNDMPQDMCFRYAKGFADHLARQLEGQ
eukprot:TRINITY_DN23034_c0_g1_i1.p1 TRINITY_DN23034_c0_g1~~TRINITY_DN23034_c0_g1_i1.p1  ORF type:complete len:269 (-),score=42.99 TRINITY_DN23034_c0_g1_i1:135-941(-)